MNLCSAKPTWTNSYDQRQMPLLSSLTPVALDVQQGYDDANVLGCYEKAYIIGSGNTVNCSGVSSLGNLFFSVGGISDLQ